MIPFWAILINVAVAILGAFISKVFFREIKPEIPDELRTLKRILLKLGVVDFIAWGIAGAWMLVFLNNYYLLGIVFFPFTAKALLLLFVAGFLASTVFGRFWQFYSSPARLVNRLEIASFRCFPSEPVIDRGLNEPLRTDLKIRLRQNGNFTVPGGSYGVRIRQDGQILSIASGNQSLGLHGETEIIVPWLIEPRQKNLWQTTLTTAVIAEPNGTPVDSAVPTKSMTVTVREEEDPLEFIKVKDIQFEQAGSSDGQVHEAMPAKVKVVVGLEQEFFNLSEASGSEVSIVLYKESVAVEYFPFSPTKNDSLYEFEYEWTPSRTGTYTFGALARTPSNVTEMTIRHLDVKELRGQVELKSIRVEPLPTSNSPMIAGENMHFYATVRNLSPKWVSNGQFNLNFKLKGPQPMTLTHDGDMTLGPNQERELGPVIWDSQAGEWVAVAEISSGDVQAVLPSDDKRSVSFSILSGQKPEPKITAKSVAIKSEKMELNADETTYTDGPWKWEHLWEIEGEEYGGKVVSHRFAKEGVIGVRLTVRGSIKGYVIEATTTREIFVFVPPIKMKINPAGVASAKQPVLFKVEVDQEQIGLIKERLETLEMEFDTSELLLLDQRIDKCEWMLGPNESKKTGREINFKMPDKKVWFPATAKVSFMNATEKIEIVSGLEVSEPVAAMSYTRSKEQRGTIFFMGDKSFDPSGAALSYSWKFHDIGEVEGIEVKQEFGTETNEYTVTLTVKNIYGAEAEDTEKIKIEEDIVLDLVDAGATISGIGNKVGTVDWKRDYRIFLELKNISSTTTENIGCSLIEIGPDGIEREILFEPSDSMVKGQESIFLISEALNKNWRWIEEGLFTLDVIDNLTRKYFAYKIRVWGETERQTQEFATAVNVEVKVSEERIEAARKARDSMIVSLGAEASRAISAIGAATAAAVGWDPSDIAAVGLIVAEEAFQRTVYRADHTIDMLKSKARE